MSTLGHQSDNSLVSNAFGFLRFPLNFMPYDSDAELVGDFIGMSFGDGFGREEVFSHCVLYLA